MSRRFKPFQVLSECQHLDVMNLQIVRLIRELQGVEYFNGWMKIVRKINADDRLSTIWLNITYHWNRFNIRPNTRNGTFTREMRKVQSSVI